LARHSQTIFRYRVEKTLLWLAVVGAITSIVVVAHWLRTAHGIEEARLLLGFPFAVVAVAVLARRTIANGGQSLLYCRRFGESGAIEQHNAFVETVLNDTCRGLALPITLQDQSIPSPRSIKMSVDALWHTATMISVFAVFVILMFTFSPWETDWPVWFVFAMVVVGVIVTLKTMQALGSWTRAMVGSGHAAAVIPKLRKVLARGRSRMGLLVVRSSDAEWQSHVEALLGEATLAIVDITGTSDAVRWETGRALELLGPEQVLFVECAGNTVECSRRTIPGVAHEVFVLRFPNPYEPNDEVDHEAQRYTLSKALRDWLVDRSTTTVGQASQHTGDFTHKAIRSKTYASLAYSAFALVSVLAFWSLLGGNTKAIVVWLTSLVAAVAAYFVSRAVMRPAGLYRSDFRSIKRGSTIALRSFLVIYVPCAILLSVWAVFWEEDGWALIWVTVMSLFVTIPAFAVLGAVAGMIIDAALLCPPRLAPHHVLGRTKGGKGHPQ
jgi:hypothetical protein